MLHRFIIAIVLSVLYAAAALCASAPGAVTDLNGHAVDPLAVKDAKAVVLLFVRTDCPISNRYAPEVQRLYAKFAGHGIAFWLVYVDPAEPASAIRKHLADYRYEARAARDARHELVKRAGVTVTPEAAVFLLTGRQTPLVYRGRIDNRYLDFGKQRAAATTHDLEDALDAIVAGKMPKARSTKAVGCFISDLQ